MKCGDAAKRRNVLRRGTSSDTSPSGRQDGQQNQNVTRAWGFSFKRAGMGDLRPINAGRESGKGKR